MDTPETPKDAPKDAPQEAPKNAMKDAASATRNLAMESAAAAKRFAKEFRDFLLKSNMLVLATAFVLGTAVNSVVQAMVRDLIMPVAGVFSASGSWVTALNLKIWRFDFPIGDFLRAIIDFVIIAGVVFVMTKAFVKEAAAAPTKQCKMCLEAIHPDAKRCKFCTSEV